LVGMAGFEPAASCSQSRRANQAALHPVCCALCPARRHDLKADVRKCTGKHLAGWQPTASPGLPVMTHVRNVVEDMALYHISCLGAAGRA
jgi:hypothetical protein